MWTAQRPSRPRRPRPRPHLPDVRPARRDSAAGKMSQRRAGPMNSSAGAQTSMARRQLEFMAAPAKPRRGFQRSRWAGAASGRCGRGRGARPRTGAAPSHQRLEPDAAGGRPVPRRHQIDQCRSCRRRFGPINATIFALTECKAQIVDGLDAAELLAELFPPPGSWSCRRLFASRTALQAARRRRVGQREKPARQKKIRTTMTAPRNGAVVVEEVAQNTSSSRREGGRCR